MVRIGKWILVFALWISVSIVGSSSAFATTVAGGSVSELGRQANWIGRLQIEEIRTIRSSAAFPSSQIKAKILEVFKGQGSVGDEVSFDVPGGDKGKSHFVVLGFPTFRVGSEYILFLDADPKASTQALSMTAAGVGVVGWSAFRVVLADPHRAESRAVIRAGEPTLLQQSSRGLAISHDRSIKSYDDFVSEIFRSLD